MFDTSIEVHDPQQIKSDILQILKNEMRERHTKKLHDKLDALEDSSNDSLRKKKYSIKTLTRSMEDLTLL